MQIGTLTVDDSFADTHVGKIPELLAKLQRTRESQLCDFYAKLQQNDSFINSNVARFLPRIDQLVEQEVRFVVAPSRDENILLDAEWSTLHAEVICHLEDTDLSLSWRGLREQLTLIAATSYGHRGSWLTDWMTLGIVVADCCKFCTENDRSAVLLQCKDVYERMNGSAETIMRHSGLTQTLAHN